MLPWYLSLGEKAVNWAFRVEGPGAEGEGCILSIPCLVVSVPSRQQ